MKIPKAADMRYLDQYTIEKENINSIDLTERAAIAFCQWFEKNIDNGETINVFSGLRNNGGDALAIARLLSLKQYDVKVYVIRYSDKTSHDFEINYIRLKNLRSKVEIHEILEDNHIPKLLEEDVVIDGILGIGLNREAEGIIKAVIDSINESKTKKVSIDIPSGLHANKEPFSNQSIIHATYTVSFEYPKMAFLLDENEKYVGKWVLVSIGLAQSGLENIETPYYLLKFKDIKRLLKQRPKTAHKGAFGHALIIAGNRGKMGAAILAAQAALRTGLGLLTLYVPNCGYEIVQISVPESMCLTDKNENYWTQPLSGLTYTTLGIGVGIGTEPETTQAFIKTLKQIDKPIVLDADALNILANNREAFNYIPKNSILTPHYKELNRLTGEKSINSYKRLEALTELAKKWNVYIILKGAHSAIATPEGRIYFNTTGNPGMATAGSGDVLTGILTSLLCQRYSPLETVLLGVYLHGMTGDIVAQNGHQNTLIASDIINNLDKCFVKLSKSNTI